MSEIIQSLEAIRDGLRTKIESLPEVVALKRVEASIVEISSLLTLISKQTMLSLPVAAAQVQKPINSQPAQAQMQQEKSQAQTPSAVPNSQVQPPQAQAPAPAVLNEAQFEEELSKLLVHKAA